MDTDSGEEFSKTNAIHNKNIYKPFHVCNLTDSNSCDELLYEYLQQLCYIDNLHACWDNMYYSPCDNDYFSPLGPPMTWCWVTNVMVSFGG